MYHLTNQQSISCENTTIQKLFNLPQMMLFSWPMDQNWGRNNPVCMGGQWEVSFSQCFGKDLAITLQPLYQIQWNQVRWKATILYYFIM